ncbi:CD151 antigen-like isoform X2 [Mixophyes fleayi]|uniref:CD151 antigen-like isoform X2 n=1 Tax=Mixophyes fleayi TaxID=3061075 RepID=UPI003F4D8866
MVTGIVLICLGASVQTKLADISMVITETSAGAPLILAVVGIVIIFLSGFGALAAVKENKILLKAFTGVLLLVFAIEILVGISAYSYRDKLQSNVIQRFNNLLNKYGADKEVTRGVDYVQQELRCCGTNNFTDWFSSSSGLFTNSVPTSCCRIIQQKCGEAALENREKLYPEGCVIKMKQWISEHVELIGAVGVGLGISQILGILFSCLLAKILQKKYVSV